MDPQSYVTAKELFALLDKQQKGFILLDELKNFGFIGQGFSDSQLHSVFSALDKDGEGKITLDDFAEAFVTLSQSFVDESKPQQIAEGQEGALSLLSAELERNDGFSKHDDTTSQANKNINRPTSLDIKAARRKPSSLVEDFELKDLENLERSSRLSKHRSEDYSISVSVNTPDDIFEGEGLLCSDSEPCSPSPSLRSKSPIRPPYQRSPSLRRRAKNPLGRSVSSPTHFKTIDRSPPDGVEGDDNKQQSPPPMNTRKASSQSIGSTGRRRSISRRDGGRDIQIPGGGFAKEAIGDLLKIVNAHTLSNLGLYSNDKERLCRHDVSWHTHQNSTAGSGLSDDRKCPPWLRTSQDWSDIASIPERGESTLSDFSRSDRDVLSPELAISESESYTSSGDLCSVYTGDSRCLSQHPEMGSQCTVDTENTDFKRGLMSPSDLSEYSTSEPCSEFDPSKHVEPKDSNENFVIHGEQQQQQRHIAATVDNETIGNLIFDNGDENHVGLYDRILNYSGVELNSHMSTSESSLHELILEAEIARKSASVVEDWDTVMKRINGVALFGGNQTIRYLWQQLSVYHSDLVQPFEDFLKSVVAEVQRAYTKCQELDTTLNSKAEQHERELARTYEEMDQILLREKEQLQEKHNEKEEHMRCEYNRLIDMKESELQEALRGKADVEARLEKALDDLHSTKSTKERLEKQLNSSISSETQLRHETDYLLQENRSLTVKLSRSVQNISDLQEQLIKMSKVAETNKENYRRRRCTRLRDASTEAMTTTTTSIMYDGASFMYDPSIVMRKFQDAVEEREYFDLNISNLTQELEDLRNRNKTLQDRADTNLNTSMLWKDGQSSPRTPESPDPHERRGSRIFGFPNGIMPISKSQRNSLVSEPSFEESTPEIKLAVTPPLLTNPVPDVVPKTSPVKANSLTPKSASTPVKVAPKVPVIPTGLEYKVIFVGDAAVGKSSLIRKISRGTFSSHRDPTANPDCHKKVVTVRNKSLTLNLWDTVGQERCTYILKAEGFDQELTFRFNSLPPSYFRRADVVVLVYDVIEEISFLNVKSWMKTIYEYTDENVLLVLCGNKIDLDHRRKVKEERAMKLAKLNDAIFLESSAKTGYNVTKLCETIASTLLERDDTVFIRETSVKVLDQDFLNISSKKMSTCC